MYVDVVRKWVLWDFLHFGVLSHTEKGTKWAYQPKLAVLRLSTALKEKYLSMDNKNAKQRAVVSNGTFI